MVNQRLCVFGILLYLLVVVFHTANAEQCNLIQSGAAATQGFGVPWNVHSSAQELILQVDCVQQSATLFAGSNSQYQYIYNKAHMWTGASWQELSLSGANLIGNTWLVGRATVRIPESLVAFDRNHYVVAYVCTWIPSGASGSWKCGCGNSTCAQPLWQLQVFKTTPTTGCQVTTGACLTGVTTAATDTTGTNTTGTTNTTNTTGNTNTTGTNTTSTNGGTTGTTGTTGDWWNDLSQYRVPITVSSGQFARKDKPVEIALNLNSLITQAGGSGVGDVESVRVVEVNSQGTIVNQQIPHQFNPTGSGAGSLTFILTGDTSAGATRTFHAYFSVQGGNVPTDNSPRLVTTTVNATDEGHNAVKIETTAGTYFFDKRGAGFSSMIDVQGSDWIAYKQGGTGAGTWWRGIPAFLPINIGNGGLFHPGFPSGATEVVFAGPVHMRMKVTSNNEGGWEGYWDLYPNFAKITLTKAGNGVFSIICECAPAGELEVNRDYYVRPNGTKVYANQEWRADIPGENGIEWAYLGDDSVNRVMYMTHNDDTKTDSGYSLEGNGGLFVLAFGRDKFTRTITGAPQTAIFGFAETKDHAQVKTYAHSAAQQVSVTLGTPRSR